jgi:hypothetical protein
MSRDTKISAVHGQIEIVQDRMRENMGMMIERYVCQLRKLSIH